MPFYFNTHLLIIHSLIVFQMLEQRVFDEKPCDRCVFLGQDFSRKSVDCDIKT